MVATFSEGGVPLLGAIVWCHFWVPCHGGMLLLCGVPLLNAMAGCDGGVPCLGPFMGAIGGAIAGCHSWVPLRGGAIAGFEWWGHSWVPWWDAIVQNIEIG